VVNPTLLGKPDAEITDISDHYLIRTHSFGGLGDEIADRSGSEHQYLFSFYLSIPSQRMNSHGERLDHGTVLEADLFWELQQFLSIYCEILRCSSFGLKAHHLQVVANVITTVLTGVALAANNLRLDRDSVSLLNTRYFAAYNLNLPRDLMALNYGIRGVGMLAMVDVYI
jgi:hypothetical protein